VWVKFILGLVVGIVIVPAAALVYFASGMAPAAAGDKPMPFEKAAANAALHTRIDREMPKSVPIQANEETFLAGTEIYQDNCAICHGLPGGDQEAIAKGMFPKPPRLFHGKGVTDDEPGETYWKVANGIRLTGMPAFKGSLSETQMWQVSLLLANADKISDKVKQELQPDSSPHTATQSAPVKKP
jgi:mono/diheme cytochrome c family protein